MAGVTRKRGKTWSYILPFKDERNRTKQLWVGGFRTRAEAEDELTKAKLRRSQGIDIKPDRLTFEQFAKRWLDYKRGQLLPYTVDRYEQQLRLRVNPVIGNLLIQKLKPFHVQAVMDQMIRDGMKPRTRSGIFTTLKGALRQAVRWELIVRNPAEAIQGPKLERRDVPFVEVATIHRIFDVAAKTPIAAIVQLAVYTGFRRGELIALTWPDVDLDPGAIRIRKAKTRAGERRISIGTDAVELLREVRRQQREWKISAYEWDAGDYVFTNGAGQPFSRSQVNHQWAKIRDEAGLGKMRFHDLRHAAVSMLIALGVDFKTIQERIGHTSIRITLDVYGHLRPLADEDAASRVDAALRRGR